MDTQDVDTVQRAIDSGGNVNGNYWTSLKLPVMRAIENNDLPTLRLLHEHGARIGPGSLFPAVSYGSAAVYKYLSDNGASPNFCGFASSLQSGLSSSTNGFMPVIGVAIVRHDLIAVKKLVRLGADISTQCELGYGQDFQYSAILAAANFGDADIMRFLLDHGADPDTLSTEGKTPLAIAAEQGNYEVVMILLASGAYHSYDLALKQPIEFAIENEDQKVVDLLRYVGAAPPVRKSPMDTIADIANVVVEGAVLVGTVWLLVEGTKYAAYADSSPSHRDKLSSPSHRDKHIRTSRVTGDVRGNSACRY